MWYAIVGHDHPNSLQKRATARADHAVRLKSLLDQGRLLLAGPFPAIDTDQDPGKAGYSGSLIVADFESLQEAREWAAADPYQAAGVYASITVMPFHKVLPQE